MLRAAHSFSAIGILATKIFGLLLAFCVSAISARLLGPDSFGIFSVIMTVVNVLAVTATLGAPVLVLRSAGKVGTANFDRNNLRQLAGRLLIRVVVFVLFGTIAGFVYFQLSGLAKIFGSAEASITLLAGGLFSVAIVISSFVRARKAVIEAQFLDTILRPLFFLTAIIGMAVIFGSQVITLGVVVCLFVSAGLMAILVALLRFKKYYGGLPCFSIRERSRIRDGLLVFGLLNAAQVLNANIDMLLLGGLGTAADAGMFRVAFSMAMLISFPLAATNSAFGPCYSEHVASGDRITLHKLVGRAGVGVVVSTLLSAAAMLVVADELIEFAFGYEYLSAVPVLTILVVGQVINGLAGPVALLLNFMHDEKFVFTTLLFSLACSVVLNLLLIPRYGAFGAAIANAVALSTWNIVLIGRAKLKHRVNPTLIALMYRE